MTKPKKTSFSALAFFPVSLGETLKLSRASVEKILTQKGLPSTPQKLRQWRKQVDEESAIDEARGELTPICERALLIFETMDGIKGLVTEKEYEMACSSCVALGHMLGELSNVSRGKQPSKREAAIQFILAQKRAGQKASYKEVEAHLELQGFPPKKGMAQTISKWVRKYCGE